MNIAESVEIGVIFQLGQQFGAFDVGGQHGIDNAIGTIGRFLRQMPQFGTRADAHIATIGCDVAKDKPQQC